MEEALYFCISRQGIGSGWDWPIPSAPGAQLPTKCGALPKVRANGRPYTGPMQTTSAPASVAAQGPASAQMESSDAGATTDRIMSGGDALVSGLLDPDIPTVFGLPGVQTYCVFDAFPIPGIQFPISRVVQ